VREQPDGLAQWSARDAPVGSRTGYLLQLMAGVGWSSLPFLPMIRQPTLVLAGNDDPVIPLVNARVMTHLLPHATLRVFDDGHLGLITSASLLGPAVSDFLR
jgi:pimeloyl-ACP methyl ester carboxylesterase